LPAGGSQTNAKEPAATPAGRSLLDAGSKLKLGLFGFNCSNGLSLTSAETSFDASWDQTLAIARRASIGCAMNINILSGRFAAERRMLQSTNTVNYRCSCRQSLLHEWRYYPESGGYHQNQERSETSRIPALLSKWRRRQGKSP